MTTSYVTAVKKDSAAVLTHVKVSTTLDGSSGMTHSVKIAIGLINAGEVWYTARNGKKGQLIKVVDGHLRSVSDGIKENNLDSLPLF